MEIIIATIVIYTLYFSLKAIRDYIMEIPRSSHRWDSSFIKAWSPKWLQGYWIGDPKLFIENDPPEWIANAIFDREKCQFKYHNIDGWHQLDGLLYILPYVYILILINEVSLQIKFFWLILIGIVSIIIFYQLFNFIFHILFMKVNKQWDRFPLGQKIRKFIQWLKKVS